MSLIRTKDVRAPLRAMVEAFRRAMATCEPCDGLRCIVNAVHPDGNRATRRARR